MIKLICTQCHNVFEARRATAKFCSPACKQRAHRIKNGQPDKRFDHLVDIKNERHSCLHCGRGFWSKGRGRTPKFCSNSCRVSANRFKISAAFHFVKAMNGVALGWTDYDCFMHVQNEGTDSVEAWAKSAGWEYSYATRRFWKRSLEMAMA